MSKNTVLPWYTDDNCLWGQDGFTIRSGHPNSSNVHVAITNGRAAIINKANAKFIVKAVNLHEELVEGLREAKEYLMEIVHETAFQQGDISTTDNLAEIIFNTEELIIKAEENNNG